MRFHLPTWPPTMPVPPLWSPGNAHAPAHRHTATATRGPDSVQVGALKAGRGSANRAGQHTTGATVRPRCAAGSGPGPCPLSLFSASQRPLPPPSLPFPSPWPRPRWGQSAQQPRSPLGPVRAPLSASPGGGDSGGSRCSAHPTRPWKQQRPRRAKREQASRRRRRGCFHSNGGGAVAGMGAEAASGACSAATAPRLGDHGAQA